MDFPLLRSFYAVGKPSYQRGVSRNDIFGLKWIIYGPKGNILDYWGIIIFWFIIPLYPIKG